VNDRFDSAPASSSRRWWLAGGVLGLAAAVALIAGVELRAWRLAPRSVVVPLFRTHDVLLVLQSIALLPFALVLSRSFNKSELGGNLLAATAGLALIAMAVLQVMYFANVAPDTLYFLPQALLGLWVLVIGRRLRSHLSSTTSRLAVVAGVGLLIVGLSLALMLAYFGWGLFSGAVRDADATGQTINRVSHYTLRVGTYLGRLGFPVWVLMIAREAGRGSLKLTRT
jgi:hypothetical protein